MINKTQILWIVFMLGTALSGQSQKGLLWKVSAPGMEKPSYLYGNMHVSEKIAFRLGTEFFDAISSVDMVALESTPMTWLDEIMHSELASNYIGDFNIKSNWGKGFYTAAFTLSPPDNAAIKRAMASPHYFSNWMLYRENKSNTDFEEETFLDMFIYQAGAKRHKPVVGLEDFRKTSYYVELADIPNRDVKERSVWFKKMLKNSNYSELMTDAYRQQNIGLLDSISKETSSINNHYWMIEKRNEVMAAHIDSIIKLGKSLFAAVGAAHLAGEAGIIQLLRQQGYKVEAMPFTFNAQAIKLRDAYDKKKLPPSPSDYHVFKAELFSVKVPVKIYETPYTQRQRQFFGPDLTNGTNYFIKQISTYGLLYGKQPEAYFQKIDSLIYEYTAGTIESRQEFSGEGYRGFDITSKTKSNDYQRMRIYITPMHLFLFKMSGKDNFVKDYGSAFFSSITLKKPKPSWHIAEPVHHEFSIDCPDYRQQTFQGKVLSLYGTPYLEAYDPADSTFYVLECAHLNNFDNIEEDDFELKRIVERFLVANGFDTLKARRVEGTPYPAAEFRGYANDSIWLRLRSIKKGTRYYLLIAANKKPVRKGRFFDSFRFNEARYLFPEKLMTDSFMLFTVQSSYLSPSAYQYKHRMGKIRREHYRNKKQGREDKSYQSFTRKYIYFSENYESIQLKLKKFNDYQWYKHIDTLWKECIDNIKDDINDKELSLRMKRATEERGRPVLYVSLGDSASSGTINYKYILQDGVLYRLRYQGDTTDKPSPFVQHFLESFTPMDSLPGKAVLRNKAALYFGALYGTDSLERINALKSTAWLTFSANDIDSIKQILDSYHFPAKETNAKAKLISKLLAIKTFNEPEYLERLYLQAGDTAIYQAALLHSLLKNKGKAGRKIYSKLLNEDIPIFSQKYDYYGFLAAVKYLPARSQARTSVQLLNYTFISNYQPHIISILAEGVDSSKIAPNDYKKYLAQILREAKIVLKMQISTEQNKQSAQSSHNRYSMKYRKNYKYVNNPLLQNYMALLMPYYKKSKEVQAFADKVSRLQSFILRNELYCRMAAQGLAVDSSIWNELAGDEINKALLYSRLQDFHLQALFPARYLSQQDLAMSMLFDKGINFKKDSVLFVSRERVNDGRDSGYVYFFKSKKQGDKKWELNYVGLQPYDTRRINVSPSVKRKNLSIDESRELKSIIEEKRQKIALRKHPYARSSKEMSFFF